MIYLLDTNIISETIKKQPNRNVISWLSSIEAVHFSLSVISFGEIRKGIEKIEDGAKKQKITQWLEIDLAKEFLGRIIYINEAVSDTWGYLTAKTSIHPIDGLIASCAIVHHQKLVTRNVKDFKMVPGLEIINPWDFSESYS